jgi:Fe-S cluster assembly protein SufD
MGIQVNAGLGLDAMDSEAVATEIRPYSGGVAANADVPIAQSPAAKRVAALRELLAAGRSGRDAAAQGLGTEPGPEPGTVAALQAQAAARIPDLAIPSTRDEEWRFTDLSGLVNQDWLGADLGANLEMASPVLTLADLEPYVLPEVAGRAVFVDGRFVAALSAIDALPTGVTIGLLDAAAAPEGLASTPGSEEVFTTLNTATFVDGLWVRAAKNAASDQTLHLLFVTTGQQAIVSPRCLIQTESQSRLRVLEDYVTLGDVAKAVTLTNSVTELLLADNAELYHSRIQRGGEGAVAYHIGKTSVLQNRDSRYHSVAVHLGSKLSRHNLEVYHRGEQVESNLYGLALAAQGQVMDTHSAILYNHPHCQSDQLYKAMAAGNGRSIFNGKVTVPKVAQQTNAAQLNRNLLLSPKARIDTKPQLEIVADNVKCSHGATVSQLEDDEIFYLQSRGIDRVSAQHLLIDAFANEILQKLPVESLRKALGVAIAQVTQG